MKAILVTLLLPILWYPAVAQGNYTVKNISIIVKGTSTLHDWEMKTSAAKGQASFTIEDKSLTAQNLSITIPAETLKSGKDAMDKNAYKALKTSDHKSIVFQLTKVSAREKKGNEYVLQAEGRLQIAGQTKQVTLNVLCNVDSNGSIRCKGEKEITMSHFGVEPPSFMFGSVKTGDSVTIVFDALFSKNSVETTSK